MIKSSWLYLKNLRKEYLEFLRNLTPAILFLGIAIFISTRFKLEFDLHGEYVSPSLALCSVIIFLLAIILNIVNFFDSSLQFFSELERIEKENKKINEKMKLKNYWKFFKEKKALPKILFFYMVTIGSTMVVLIAGIAVGLSYYKSFSIVK